MPGRKLLSGEAMKIVMGLIMLLPSVVGVCSSDSGPSGALECFQSYYYNNLYQWGTCLSNDYIQQKSKVDCTGNHICRDNAATYCYYQCMIEVHGLDAGNVTDDCACEPNATQPTSNPNELNLPTECNSPSGADCDWYKKCLEKKFQCPEGQYTDGITFAENFCRMYANRSHLFSPLGREWVGAARKCLQVELVPLMRSYETYSCEDVKERAYRSHAACYTNPFKDARTICEMPSVDFWHVFWIIRSAFISSYSEALFGLLKVSESCNNTVNNTVRDLHSDMRMFTIIVQVKANPTRHRRGAQESLPLKSVRSSSSQARAIAYASLQATTSASDSKVNLAHRRSRRQTPSNQWEGETDNQTTYHLLASELADELAKQLGWNVSGVEWFAYGLPVDVNVAQAVVFLADKRALGLDSPSLSASPNMTELVQQVAHAIQTGELRVTLEGQQARLQSLEACGDIDCRAPYLKVNAAPTPVDGHSGELGSPSSSVLFVLLAAVVKSLVV